MCGGGKGKEGGDTQLFLESGSKSTSFKTSTPIPPTSSNNEKFFTGSLNFFRILVDFVSGIMFFGVKSHSKVCPLSRIL